MIISLLIFSFLGCSSAPAGPAAVGDVCHATGDGPKCGPALWCDLRQGDQAKVGVDKKTAVGICQAKAAIGEACSSAEACLVGSCTYADPANPVGVCTEAH